MPLQHVNRKGETYYLFAGQTKTGKPKYFVSKKESAAGRPLDAVPEGYELHESPTDGLVHVRKVRPTQILPQEREQTFESVRRLTECERFFVEIDGDTLVVYWPDCDAEAFTTRLGNLLGGSPAMREKLRELTATHFRYSPMMRFLLVDADRRLFAAQRWCFRGSIDDWILLSGPNGLTALLDEFAPHLGQESFYDLM